MFWGLSLWGRFTLTKHQMNVMKPSMFSVHTRDDYIYLHGGISSRIGTVAAGAGVEHQRLRILGECSAASVIRQSSQGLGRLFWFHLSISAIIYPPLLNYHTAWYWHLPPFSWFSDTQWRNYLGKTLKIAERRRGMNLYFALTKFPCAKLATNTLRDQC